MKSVAVVKNFLNDEITRHCVNINQPLPLSTGFVVVIDGRIDCFKLIGQPILLYAGKRIGRVISDSNTPLIILLQINLIGLVIIVHLHKPTIRDSTPILIPVGLLIDVETVLADADRLGEQIQANVVAIEYHFHRLGRWCPFHTHDVAEL